MALSPPITLAEARQSVLLRVGMGIQGNQSANAHAQVDEFIRSAVRQLYVEAAWTVLRLRVTLTLTAGVADQDWPDDTEPGSIQAVAVVDADGRQCEVVSGFRANERASIAASDVTDGRPVVYYYRDNVIQFSPPPSTTWKTAIIDYVATSGKLTEDDDTIPVDAEACIQHAALTYKRYWGLPTSNEESVRFQRYVDQIRANQSEGEGFMIGGAKSRDSLGSRPNRVNRNQLHGRDTPYADGWNPF